MNTLLFDESRPIQFQDVLPSKVDMVVIGGGEAGICKAPRLKHSVTTADRVAFSRLAIVWGRLSMYA